MAPPRTAPLPAPGDLSLGRRVMALVDELARFTDEPGRITRLYLSPAHREAAEATLGMMREAGLDAAIESYIGTVLVNKPDERAVLGARLGTPSTSGPLDDTAEMRLIFPD